MQMLPKTMAPTLQHFTLYSKSYNSLFLKVMSNNAAIQNIMSSEAHIRSPSAELMHRVFVDPRKSPKPGYKIALTCHGDFADPATCRRWSSMPNVAVQKCRRLLRLMHLMSSCSLPPRRCGYRSVHRLPTTRRERFRRSRQVVAIVVRRITQVRSSVLTFH